MSAPELELPTGRSRTVALAGLLLLLATLLQANPWFGAMDARWPWQVLASGRSPITMANWTLWMATGVTALLWGLFGTPRVRGTVLGAAVLVLLFTCSSHEAGLRLEENSLFVQAGLTALLAGFMLQARGERGRTVALAAVGGALVLWTLACTFRAEAGLVPRSQLVMDLRDLAALATGSDLPTARAYEPLNLATVAVMLPTALLGVLSLARLRGRAVGWIGCALVLATFLLRPVARYVTSLRDLGFDSVGVARQVSEVLIPAGFGLAFLGAAVLADLVRRDPEVAT